uniref:Protein Nef n=1 Tax=Human immunodeficiency virus type 1 TaxID=11676 RepID=A0A0C5K058_HV1|nr:nef protein [Human immunodeficiency virus 1]
MGNPWSKASFRGGLTLRERLSQIVPPPEEVGAGFQDLDNQGPFPGTNPPAINADCPGWEPQEEKEEVGFPLSLQVPLRPMIYEPEFWFFFEKGGLEGLIYSKKRQEILDLWVYNTQGYFPDWQNYTPGPGVRYPLTFGWCFKLVPVDPKEVEENTEGENNCLLHPMNQHGMEDEHREVLKWKFDSHLARRHMARELHPEYYKDC